MELFAGRTDPVIPDSGEWRVRISHRARQLAINVHAGGTVEVVVPRGTRARTISRFVADHRTWIDRAIAASGPVRPPAVFPERIVLPYADETCIEIQRERANRPGYRRRGHLLTVRSQSADERESFNVLRRWVLAEAGRHLKPRILKLGHQIGLVPGRVQVRLQKTIWGSCSSTGTVSLNASLLFIEAELVNYLFIHELCHLRHQNHSSAYWQMVETFEPRWRQLDQRLEAARHGLPGWLARL